MINIEDLLEAGETITTTATGNSMRPTFRNGRDKICIAPCDVNLLEVGDVVFFFRGDQYCVHRIIEINGDSLVIRGDGNSHNSKFYERVRRSAVLGKVVSGTMRGGRKFCTEDEIWKQNTRRVMKYHFFIALWHRFIRIIRSYPLSIVALCSLFYLSFLKPSDKMVEVMVNSDKIVHLIMYFCASSVFWLEWMLVHKCRMKGNNLRNGFLYCVLFPIILGVLIELGQEYLTEYRGGDWKDAAANTCGSLIATVVSFVVTYPVLKRWHRNENKRK